MQIYIYNTYSINTTLLRPTQVFNLENGLYCVQFGLYLTTFGHKLLLFSSAQPDSVWRSLKK